MTVRSKKMAVSAQSIRRPFDEAAQRIASMSETRANRRAARVADVLVSVALLALGLRRGHVHLPAALLAIMSGLLLFTLVEYCFHRWMFHGSVPLFEPGHRRHHEHPLGDDAMPFFLPPLALLGIVAVCSLATPAGVAWLLTGGLAAGYAIYGLSHDFIHNTRFQHPLFRRWAASHHIHHFHPDRNFGVSTPIWDIVLGTRYAPKARPR
jgi:sterol desaturase/sphingolipid hydroxylase (fatty acid hydroxylase superfamily)